MNLRISALFPVVAAFFLAVFMIGCAASEDTSAEATKPAPVDTVAVSHPSGPTRDELQQELDALKTENIQLKEKLSAAENTNRSLLSKASDLEAAIAAREQSAKAATPAAPAKRSMEGVTSADDLRTYDAAVAMVKKGTFSEAIPKFQALLSSSVKEDYAPNCRYWMGLAYFGLKDYKNALEQFNGVFEFKFSNKKDDAQLMIAQCYEKQGDMKQAKLEYQKLVKLYPASEFVKRAKKKIQQL
jgi:tol-pal system protein YbgF